MSNIFESALVLSGSSSAYVNCEFGNAKNIALHFIHCAQFPLIHLKADVRNDERPYASNSLHDTRIAYSAP
jgi:hypothetical protein